MPEVKTEVKTYQVKNMCGCGKEYMVSTGVVFTTCPLKYEHKCPSCGVLMSSITQYPYIRYETI